MEHERERREEKLRERLKELKRSPRIFENIKNIQTLEQERKQKKI